MVLSTASKDCTPRASTLLFAVDDDFTFVFATHGETVKVANLRENPKVAFAVGVHPPMNVQVVGEAEEILGEEGRKAVFDELAATAAKHPDLWPPIFRTPGEYAVFKVRPEWIRVLDLQDPHINESKPPYREVEL